MIDVAHDARCKACKKLIVRVPGRRPREYCTDACRQRYYREHHQASTIAQQDRAALQEKLMRLGTEKEKVERRVRTQRTRIGELEAEARRLRARINELAHAEIQLGQLQRTIDELSTLEEAFRRDTSVHSFKKFLTNSPYHSIRAGCAKILDQANGFPSAGSRGTYTDAMRRAGFTQDEQADVWAAWRDMLKEELIKRYYTTKGSNL
jgi:hypothetical protein